MKFGKKEFISLFLAGIMTAMTVSCGSEKTVTESYSESEPDAEPGYYECQRRNFYGNS